MNPVDPNTRSPRRDNGFTLVEMIIVIAIMSILMTAGAIGLGSIGGKGVTSGVATAEALFDEARAIAVGKNIRACVLIAKDLTNNGQDNLRRIVVAYENIDTITGAAKNPTSNTPDWVITTRGTLLPDQVFFSQKYSKKNHDSGGDIDTVTASKIKSTPGDSATAVKASYEGTYYIYIFNSEGICSTPGASFIVGNGARGLSATAVRGLPKVTSTGKRDFGGFVVWRNGRTSTFRNTDQIKLPATVTEF